MPSRVGRSAAAKTITIVIADDHHVVRSGLRLLRMPGAFSSIDAIPRVRGRSPDTSVVVLTTHEDPSFARTALQAGVRGYVGEPLHHSIRTVESHRAHIQQKLRRSTRGELVRYALDYGLLDD